MKEWKANERLFHVTQTSEIYDRAEFIVILCRQTVASVANLKFRFIFSWNFDLIKGRLAVTINKAYSNPKTNFFVLFLPGRNTFTALECGKVHWLGGYVNCEYLFLVFVFSIFRFIFNRFIDRVWVVSIQLLFICLFWFYPLTDELKQFF